MLDKPVLLLESDTVPNAAVIVTSTADSDGNPVVVALHLSRSEGFDIVTRVASLYGRKNSRDFLAEQMLRGNLLGYSKKEANRLLHRDGLQLPRRNTAVDLCTANIAQDASAVNTHSMVSMKKSALPKVRQIKRHQKLPAGKTVILQFLGTAGMISVMPVSLFGFVLSTMRTGYCSSAGSVCAATQGSPMASSCS